jgi:hypothetical protein
LKFSVVDQNVTVNYSLNMARRRKDEPQVDWQAIYDDFRKADSSIREIARRHGISATAINNKIAREKWTIDGPANYPPVTDDEPDDDDDYTPDTSRDKAKRTSTLLKRSKDLAHRLLSELENTTAHYDEIRDIIITTESDHRRRRAALKAISTEQRSKTLKDLVTTLKTIEAPVKSPKAVSENTGKPEGKKAQRQAEAEKAAASGAFAVPAAPLRVVGGKP